MGGEVRLSGELEARIPVTGGGEEALLEVERAFIAVGCNRVVGAVSWGPCNLVAFGAHHAVAIFSSEESRILVTLPGHKDFVNCVLWLPAGNQIASVQMGRTVSTFCFQEVQMEPSYCGLIHLLRKSGELQLNFRKHTRRLLRA